MKDSLKHTEKSSKNIPQINLWNDKRVSDKCVLDKEKKTSFYKLVFYFILV